MYRAVIIKGTGAGCKMVFIWKFSLISSKFGPLASMKANARSTSLQMTLSSLSYLSRGHKWILYILQSRNLRKLHHHHQIHKLLYNRPILHISCHHIHILHLTAFLHHSLSHCHHQRMCQHLWHLPQMHMSNYAVHHYLQILTMSNGWLSISIGWLRGHLRSLLCLLRPRRHWFRLVIPSMCWDCFRMRSMRNLALLMALPFKSRQKEHDLSVHKIMDELEPC